MPTASGEGRKLKVFISYARHDSAAFAQNLLNGLTLVGFDPFLDQHDIAAGEDWEARLAGLIQAADTVVFVLSPLAAKSERCGWEVDKAIALAKRIIPVVALPVPDADLPPLLRRLNYISFADPHAFARALGQLADALKADLEWVREHTRLAELAARWDARGRLEALLMRGAELEAARQWMASWKTGAPDVSDLHRAFLAASADAEAARANLERQRLEEIQKAQAARAEALAQQEMAVKALSRRTAAGLIGAGTLTVAAGGLAFWGVDAERRFRNERERVAEAEKRSVDEELRREALRTDISGQLSAYAASPGQQADDGEPNTNSPYTRHTLDALKIPEMSLQKALAKSHIDVHKSSRVQQRPFLSSDLNGDLFLQRHPPTRRRRALIVSVDKVNESTALPNPPRDARAWEEFLTTRCGFETRRLENPRREEVMAALREMAFQPLEKKARLPSLVHKAAVGGGLARVEDALPNTLLLFVYSGAGGYQKGANFLMAADTNLSNVSEAPASMIALREVEDVLRRSAAASVLILDTNFEDVDPTPSR